MVVIGDELQGVYSFKEADCRYLTMAEEVFGNDRAKYIQVSELYNFNSFFL
jgi:hypothetical protein